MIILDIQDFLPYYEKIRARTLSVIKSVPPEHIEWTYKRDKFTFGDIIRHIATIERYMYGETVQFKPSRYQGCGQNLASGYDEVLDFMHRKHEESIAIFSRLTPEDLQKKTITPGKIAITIWKWLRAMIEHEVHHRGQLFIYLGMLGVTVPPLYGLTSEQVQEESRN